MTQATLMLLSFLAAGAAPTATPRKAHRAPVAAAAPAVAPLAQAAAEQAEEEPSWLDEVAQEPPQARGSPVAYALLGMLAVLAAGGAWVRWQRLRKKPLLAKERERIDLLAVRSLGGKQRLCLVEVCGERLLIATSDHEVTLLSHLTGPDLGAADMANRADAEVDMADVDVGAANAGVAAPAQAAAATAPGHYHQVATPRSPAAVQPSFAAVQAQHMPVAPRPAAAVPQPAPVVAQPLPSAFGLSRDVEGIGRWRQPQPPTNQHGAPS